MIEENVKNLLREVPKTNAFGEQVTIVAAVKLQTPDDINRAVSAGIKEIGDNHVQEFRDKYDEITGSPRRHFIGRLQTNKIKYLLGKVDLYHSVDRMNLAEELSKKSVNAGLISEILLQVNIGCEETKGGFELDEVENAYDQISRLGGLKMRGLMAMLPFTDDEKLLRSLAAHMREKYDKMRAYACDFNYLSMGMSGDWRLCIEEGSNMIRVGTSIFGKRTPK